MHRPTRRLLAWTLSAWALAADPAAARCTTRADLAALGASLGGALACAERALRGEIACTSPPPPACAGTAATDTAALVFATPPGPLADRRALSAQLRCQHAIVRTARHFVVARAAERLAGQRAEGRSRRSTGPILERCTVPVEQDASGQALPELGGPCAGVVGPAGAVVDPERLVHCLRPALERIVNEIAPAALSPNILVVLTDDQRWDTLGYMDAVVKQLVERGVTFENSFATTPVCCPSRSSLYSGEYAHHHGNLGNNAPYGAVAFPDASTLAVWLSRAGYRTALFGKYMNGNFRLAPTVPPGWDAWQTFVQDGDQPGSDAVYYDYTLNENGTLIRYGHADADYSTDLLKKRTLRFITANAALPFFVVYAPFAPHEPAIPAARHAGRFASLPPWRPPSYDEADVSDKPDWVKFMAHITTPAGNVQTDVLRQHQLETLLAVDEAVAALLAQLEALGLTDDTLVVFTSDNGFMWGEHWWWSKWAAYEESIRVPLVIRWPARMPVAVSRPELALNIDLAPTFAEAAGVPVPPTVDGQSLLPAVDGTGTTWRDDFVTEAWGAIIVPPYVALRTTRWKLIRDTVRQGIAEELYDLSIDPYELDNLAQDPAFAEVRATLSTRLDALLAAPPGGPFASLVRATPLPVPAPLGGSENDELLGDLQAAGIDLR